MIKILRHTLLVLTAIVITQSCADQNENANEKSKSSDEDVVVESQEKVKRIKEIFFSLPSPLELTVLFKKEGVEYHENKLHTIKDRDKYVTTVKKSLNLGVYGADLSYAGLFAKHENAIQYFSVSQVMAADLGIGQTFQKAFISRLERNANNKDTLLQVISDFFLENDSYLKDKNQQNISTFVLVGGWVEGLYLGTHMISDKTNAVGVKEIIISQLNSLDNLLILLTDVGKSHEMMNLKSNMKLLRGLYNEVEYNDKDSAVVELKTNPNEIIIDNGSGYGVMHDSTLNKIKLIVTDIRSSIIR
jgi:hypothetical protein